MQTVYGCFHWERTQERYGKEKSKGKRKRTTIWKGKRKSPSIASLRNIRFSMIACMVKHVVCRSNLQHQWPCENSTSKDQKLVLPTWYCRCSRVTRSQPQSLWDTWWNVRRRKRTSKTCRMKQKQKEKQRKHTKNGRHTKRTCKKHSKTHGKRDEKVDKRSKMERKRNRRE